MTVDTRIRERLVRTSADLPEPDTDAALEAVLARADSARRRRGAFVGVAAAAAVVAGMLLVSPLLDRKDDVGELQPALPAPTGTDGRTGDIDDRLTRPRDTTSLPVEQLVGPWGGGDMAQTYRWDDPADSVEGETDIRRVRLVGTTQEQPRYLRPHLDLADVRPGPLTAPGPDVEYGIVADHDADGVADCELAITTDTEVAAHFRAWSTRLADGHVTEQVGPPYGPPFDFWHPRESGRPQMEFVIGIEGPECDTLDRATHIYTWAASLADGELVAIDFAPDAAWLEMPGATGSAADGG